LEPYPCKPVEPIGAGDGFNAGFLAGLVQGRDVVTAGRMGAICGALATQTPGDVEGYPDSDQMEAALSGSKVIYR
jgi:2-dehydro-3-deoxygluconokinase